MANAGRVLIADDEETVLELTAEVLRQEGYECDCSPDALMATQLLERAAYDLVITDIQMPGNSNLEFVKRIPYLAEGVPVILVTGYPSLNSAMESIQLPVVAYLIKPVDFELLLEKARVAVKGFQAFQTAREMRRLVQRWKDDLSEVEDALKISSPSAASTTPIDAFLRLTFQNIVGSLSNIIRLSGTLAADKGLTEACHILNCPRHRDLNEALGETIEVLKKPKAALKPKELGTLRAKLEQLLRNEG